MTYWWDEVLSEQEEKGRNDADNGRFDPPFKNSTIPEDEAENNAYKRGFINRRNELGDNFEWR